MKDDPGYLKSMGERATARYNEFAFFRRNLVMLRAHNDLTGEKMAEILNVRPKRILDLECGRCPPKFEELRFLANFFEITLDQLLYQKATLTFTK